MTFRTSLRTACAALALALLPAVPAAAQAPVPSPGVSLDAPGTTATGDRLTVGIQPATATAPDPRAHFDYRLGAGDVRQDHLAVFNYSAKPVTLRLAARDALTTASGGLDAAPTASAPHDAGAWIALATTTLRMKPRSRVIVPFQVGVPYDATPGDHTGAVVVALTTTSASGDRRVDVENRVGLRLYLRVAGPVTPRLDVTDLRARYAGGLRPSWRGPVDVSFTVRNTGNVRLGARERIVLRDLAGRVVGRASIDGDVVLLPGSAVPVRARVDDVAALARLRATVTVEPLRLDGDAGPVLPPVERSTTVLALPWLALLGLVAIGLAFVAWRVRRRLRPRRPARHRKEPRPPRHAQEPAGMAVFTSLTLGIVVLLVAVTTLAFAAPALAAGTGPWTATVTPRSGADDTPIEVTTSGGCPAPATNVLARVYGAGLPAEGVNVVGNTAAGVRADRPFEVPLVVTMRDVARDQPKLVTLRGRYRLDVTCRTARDPRPLGVYAAAIVFTSPTAWHADAPVTTARGPVATATPPAGGGDAAQAAPGGAAQAPGGAGVAAAPGGAAGRGSAAAPGTVAGGEPKPGASSAAGRSSGLTPYLLAVLVAAAVAASFAAGRHRGVRPTLEGNARP